MPNNIILICQITYVELVIIQYRGIHTIIYTQCSAYKYLKFSRVQPTLFNGKNIENSVPWSKKQCTTTL